MKEIIYLDTNLVNSMLAQLNEGLVQSYSEELSTQEGNTDTRQDTKKSSGSFTGGVKIDTGLLPGGGLELRANKSSGGDTAEIISTTFLDGQKDILNKAFHDYSLNILIEELEKQKLIKENEPKFIEGEIYFIEDNFKVYDFELIKRAADTDIISDFLMISQNNTDMSLEEAEKISKNNKGSAIDKAKATQVLNTKKEVDKTVLQYRKPEIFGVIGDNLLKDIEIIKANQIIALAKKDFFRTSSTIFAFTDTTRKAKILFRVISTKDRIYDANNVGNIASDHIRLLPTVMLDIVLGSLKIVNIDDVMVAPIAIYYE